MANLPVILAKERILNLPVTGPTGLSGTGGTMFMTIWDELTETEQLRKTSGGTGGITISDVGPPILATINFVSTDLSALSCSLHYEMDVWWEDSGGLRYDIVKNRPFRVHESPTTNFTP